MSRVIFGFCRKLARTKTQRSIEKASEHNGHTVFSWVLVLLTRALTGLVPTLSYRVYSLFVSFPHNLHQLTLSPPLPPEYAVTARVRLHLGLGGHAKAYNRVTPRPSNEADMMSTMYPTDADLSVNHRA